MTTPDRSHRLKRLLISASLLLWWLTACGRQVGSVPTPPTIHYGEDVCELCGMIVSEAVYAGAYVTGDGHGHVFDDIGDMIQSHLTVGEVVTAFFVHDYDDNRWIRAETAHFILRDPASTPMGSGLVACEQQDRAEALSVQLDGRLMTFEEVLAYYQNKTSLPEKDIAHTADHH